MLKLQTTQNYKAEITNQEYKQNYTFQSTEVLTLDVSYPNIYLMNNLLAQERINSFYYTQVQSFIHYFEDNLLPYAIQSHGYTKSNGFPFHSFTAVMKYTITLNANCHLSSYSDQYEFMGGAHGTTLRSSVNWDLNIGNQIQLNDLFLDMDDSTQIIKHEILKIANKEMQHDNPIYFEDYPALIEQYFKPENFYLTPTGLTIYYQQYDIAPYAGGIREFTIPYNDLGISHPSC